MSPTAAETRATEGAGDRREPDGAAGDARLRVFESRGGWQVGILGGAFAFLILAAMLASAALSMRADGMVTVPVDMRTFWAAAVLAWGGEAVAAHDLARLEAVHQGGRDVWMIWTYPPGLTVLIAPLGALTFIEAWVLFTVLSLGAIILAVRPYCSGMVPPLLCFALAPAWIPTLYIGQTTALWSATLLAALWALRGGRPVLAGVLIGLLTLKPQLGLLIPVALIAAGAWRTIGAATVTTVLVAAVPSFYTGVEIWPALFEAGRLHADRIALSIPNLSAMCSPLSALIGLGIAPEVAAFLQAGLSLGAAIAVWIAWRRSAVSPDLKAAVLMAAILLSTPYLWFYETAMLPLVALFLVRAGALRLRRAGLVVFALLWLGTAPPMLLHMLHPASPDIETRLFAVPVVLLAMALALAALARGPADAPLAPARRSG